MLSILLLHYAGNTCIYCTHKELSRFQRLNFDLSSSLNLAHNNISHLSNDGIDLEALQILDLQNNRISELSHFSVQKMRSLR